MGIDHQKENCLKLIINNMNFGFSIIFKLEYFQIYDIRNEHGSNNV